MESMSGSKALMKALKKEGVKQVFGIPGGANLPMYDELYKSDIRHILVRHEQSAAHMADGFGRVTFVLVKKPVWKIVHIHLSKISEK